MQYIIYVGLLAGLVAVFRLPPGRALVAVYLPILLLLPDAFHAVTPGLPDPSFNTATIVPIFAAAFFVYVRDWRPSVADLLVIGFATTVAYSEYTNAGYSEAQNLMFGVLTQVVAPYFAARWAIDRERLHVAAARRFVILVFALAIIGVFEFRFGWNPFLILGEKLFFPGQGLGWVTTFRHGFARVAGPYAHAIAAGMMMVMAYRLNRWLEWGGHWEPQFRGLPRLPWSKGRVISVVLVLGSLMTVARGPWLGALVGAVLVNAARLKERKRALIAMFVALVVVAVPGYIGFQSYLDVKPGADMTLSQETAIYRKVLFEKYIEIALDRSLLGWGRTTWPKVPGMESIDNHYLLVALMHGVLATLLFVALMAWMCARLLAKGLAEPPEANSLAFTFAGIIVAIAVSLVTVYLGENVMPAFFLILGWAEGYIQGGGYRSVDGTAAPPQPAPAAPRFRRVIS